MARWEYFVLSADPHSTVFVKDSESIVETHEALNILGNQELERRFGVDADHEDSRRLLSFFKRSFE